MCYRLVGPKGKERHNMFLGKKSNVEALVQKVEGKMKICWMHVSETHNNTHNTKNNAPTTQKCKNITAKKVQSIEVPSSANELER